MSIGAGHRSLVRSAVALSGNCQSREKGWTSAFGPFMACGVELQEMGYPAIAFAIIAL
jgi:hypothetical protein